MTTDLFAVHPDPAVRYHRGITATVTAVNPAFVQAFEIDTKTVVGEPVAAALAAVGIQSDLEEIEADAGAVESDSDETSAGLTAEMEAVASNGRTYAIRRVDTEDGSYLLLTDVSTVAERQRALEAKNDRLEGFARTLSHDLRNPLEVAQSRLMAARETGEQIHFEKIEAAHARIGQLVADVLKLAKSGSAISGTEPVGLAQLATAAWESIDAEVATLDVDDELGTVEADPERLRTLFENLFRNSVHHAGADVTITVEARATGFVVGDDGPGVPPEQREAVFEAGVTTEETTGLGLAIVSEIAAAHGWSVSLTESPAGGAQFEFRVSSA